MFKSALIAAGLLLGSTALACPNLAGQFVCTQEDGSVYDITITQRVENNATVYDITDSEGTSTLIADGVARTETYTEDGFVYTFTTVNTCQAETVVSNMVVSLADEVGNKIAEMTMNMTAALDAQKNLAIVVNGDGYTENISCARK